MSEIAHRIRRLRWQVRAPGADAALGVRLMLRELMPDIEAALHAALDAHGAGDAVRYLDQLQLQLKLPGQASAEVLMQELAAALGRALQEAAGEMRLTPLFAVDGEAVAPASTGGGPLDARAALLCELRHLKHHAPQRLRQSLQAAWAERSDGESILRLDGRVWPVREAELGHWLRWVEDVPGAGVHGINSSAMPEAVGASLPQVAGMADAGAAQPSGMKSSLEKDLPEQAAQVQGNGPGGVTKGITNSPPTAATLQHVQAQLMHYLRTGQLDWTLAGLPAEQARPLLQEAAADWVGLGMLPQSWAQGAALSDRLGALCRWLSLLTEAQRLTVWRDHGPGSADHAQGQEQGLKGMGAAVQVSLNTLMQRVSASPSDRLHALALWLDRSASDGDERAWMASALGWVSNLAAQGPAHDAWQLCLAHWRSLLADANGERAQMPGVTQGEPGLSADGRMSTESQPSLRQGTGPSAQQAQGVALSLPTMQPKPSPILREPVHSQGHVIALAGLVLLHPYLARCFQALGWHEQGQRGPLSEAMWPRAASLMHELAMGDAQAPLECNLGLIKLLLGRDEHEALSHGLPALLTHEREEAASLLQAVLGHWPALKGTSVTGLRQSFLQRRGWLEPLDRAWQLRVEPAAYDMLLGSLPWGLSMVKLPWMDRPMHVEWSAS